jgi:hypothetical protein
VIGASDKLAIVASHPITDAIDELARHRSASRENPDAPTSFEKFELAPAVLAHVK